MTEDQLNRIDIDGMPVPKTRVEAAILSAYLRCEALVRVPENWVTPEQVEELERGGFNVQKGFWIPYDIGWTIRWNIK